MPSFSADFDRGSDLASSRSTTRILISVIRKLSDHSSDPSLREDERIKLEGSYDVVDARLEKIVKAKQDGLNRTVGDFQKICSNVHAASDHLAKVKANLAACKEQIRCKREELKRLHNESEENHAVLDIFERIGTISKMSQLVQECIENEQYVKAAEIIQQVLTNFHILSDIPVVSRVPFSADIKEQLYSKIVEAIEFELYEQSVSALANGGSEFYRGVNTHSQPGIFAQTDPQMSSKINAAIFGKTLLVDHQSERGSANSGHVEETLTELVKALSVLGKLRDASGVLQAHFTAKIETLRDCTLLEIVNSTSAPQRQNFSVDHDEDSWHLLTKHEQKLALLFQNLHSKLIKIVEYQNIFIQKMNVALLQAEKSSSCSSIYSISMFLTTFQNIIINLLETLLRETSESSSGAEKYYSRGGASSSGSVGGVSSFTSGATGSRLTGSSGDDGPKIPTFVSFASSINRRTSVQNSPSRLRIQSSGDTYHSNQSTMSKQASAGSTTKISNFLNTSTTILNIKAIYRTLDEMCVYVSVQMGCEKHECDLYKKLQQYINQSLQNYLTNKIKDTVENKIARDSVGAIESSRTVLAKLDSEKPLAQSCILAYELLSYLAHISKQLPDFAELFTNLLSHFLGSFYSRVHHRYISIFSRQNAASEEAFTTSLKLIGDKDVSHLLGFVKEALHSKLREDENVQFSGSQLNAATEELVSKLMTSLNETANSKKLRTITKVKQYSELFQVISVLSYSINWLVGKTSDLVSQFDSGFSQHGRHSNRDVDKGQGTLWAGSDLARSVSDLKVIADNLLIGLNLELKVVTFCQLTNLLKNSRKSSLGSNQQQQIAALELHTEVKDLSRLLSEASITASKFLPESDLHFLFDCLPLFIQNVYLSNSSTIVNASQSELDLLVFDVLELKQFWQKTNITDKEQWARNNEAFDKITSFYEFLRYPPKDIIRIANQKQYSFHKDTWTVILNASLAKFGKSGDSDLSAMLNDLKDVTSCSSPITSSVLKISSTNGRNSQSLSSSSFILNGASHSSSAL